MKMTVKSLSEEFNVMKEQLKEFESLKIKFSKLETEVKLLRSQEKDIEITRNKMECKECGKSFPSKTGLKMHALQVHLKVVDCKLCDQTFSYNHELEVHVKEHAVENEFKCEVCEKEFYLEWRLMKHMSVHSDQTKPCKYDSRNMPCPFDIIGCKFKHASKDSESSKSAETSVEQKEHLDEVKTNDDVNPTGEEATSSDMDSKIQEEGQNDYFEDDQIKCPLCECTFLDQDEVTYHMKADHFQWI